MPGCASTAASGDCTSAITPTRSRPFSRASPRSWMSRIAMSAAPALQQLQRVGRGARLADLELDALGGVEAAVGGDVDPGVDRVGREVEQQRGRARWVARSRRRRRNRRGQQDQREEQEPHAHPRSVRWGRMRRRVTFSRNLTLSLSRTCRCYCKYCAFATHQPHLHEPDEVERILDGAARRNVKELLVLTGEAPDDHPGVARQLRRARPRRLHRLRRLGLRAGARARAAARTRTSACSSREDLARCAR